MTRPITTRVLYFIVRDPEDRVLKHPDGWPRAFATEVEAQAEADRLRGTVQPVYDEEA